MTAPAPLGTDASAECRSPFESGGVGGGARQAGRLRPYRPEFTLGEELAFPVSGDGWEMSDHPLMHLRRLRDYSR